MSGLPLLGTVRVRVQGVRAIDLHGDRYLETSGTNVLTGDLLFSITSPQTGASLWGVSSTEGTTTSAKAEQAMLVRPSIRIAVLGFMMIPIVEN